MSVSVCVCEEDVYEKREERKSKKKKEKNGKTINLFIQINNVMPIITIVILVHSRQDKTREGKARQDEIYIDSLHIMKMSMTITMSMTMTIIIQ